MRHLVYALTAFLALWRGVAAARTITDSAGRQVVVPDRIERVFAAGPPASVLLYVLAPDRMIGWPRAPRPEELPYIAPEYRDLPEVGWLTGRGDTVNLEVLLQAKPDLIFDFGSVRDTFVSLAERVQAQTGIPSMLIDGTFANTPAAVRLLGAVLGVEQRAERIASYVEGRSPGSTPRSRSAAGRAAAGLSRARPGRPRDRAAGLDQHRDHRARGRDQRRGGPERARRGIAEVPIEQIVLWNPGTVITWDRNFYDAVWKDFYWQGVDAVAAGRVYLSPTAPFGWIDRPPSLNRLIGLEWLAGLFYPDQVDQDLREVTRSFYDLFYHVDLTDAELDRLLQWASGRALRAWPGPARLTTPLLALGLLALALTAAFIGPYPISPADALRAAWHRLSGEVPAGGATLDTVLFFVRLPRIAAAMLVGGALAAELARRIRACSATRWSRRTSSASRAAPGSGRCSASSCRCRCSASSSSRSWSGSARSASCC